MRFDDVIRRAKSQTALNVLFLSEIGQENNLLRDIFLSDLLKHLKTVHIRHYDIQQNDIRLIFVYFFSPSLPFRAVSISNCSSLNFSTYISAMKGSSSMMRIFGLCVWSAFIIRYS